MAIITYPLNNIEYDAADAALFNCTRTSGVFAADDNLKVVKTSGLGIKIQKGIAWINNDAFSGMVVGVKADETLTLDAADSTYDRIDRIVLGFNANDNGSAVYVKKGTPASSPVPQARTTTASVYELVLCDIRVRAGATALQAADLTDQRANADVCGIMSDGVTREAPAKHASTHKTGGTDPLSASDVGADPAGTAASAVNTHNASGSAHSSLFAGRIPTTDKDAANGVAGLDADAKVKAIEAVSTIDTKTANHTLTAGDNGKMLLINSASSVTITIPTGLAYEYEVEVVRYGTGAVSFSPAAGVTIRSAGSNVNINNQYGAAVLKCLGSNEWLLVGDLG